MSTRVYRARAVIRHSAYLLRFVIRSPQQLTPITVGPWRTRRFSWNAVYKCRLVNVIIDAKGTRGKLPPASLSFTANRSACIGEMLKKLALKFKNQSLNEVRPYEPQLFLTHESDLEDGRSDQEDEEITDINYDTKASSSVNNNNVNGSNSKSGPLYPTLTDANEHISFDESRKAEAGASRFTPIEAPVVRDYSYSAEKRKWSQMNAHKLLNQLASGGDSSSSDDEVKELCGIKKPVSMAASSSSPPGKVTILSKHSAFTSRSRAVKPVEGHARKKHRVVFAAECDAERPSLDFDKMQKVTFKKSHLSGRPRVRIRAISHSPQRPGLCNPEVLCFRPIQFSAHRSLAPVEEPGFVF